MIATLPNSGTRGVTKSMILAWLAFFDGVIGVALAAAGIVAAHFSFAPPFTGFTIFVAGLFFAVLGIFFAILALIVMLFSASRRTLLAHAVWGGVLGLIVVGPIVGVVLSHHYPAINDITTDTTNPPEFVHAQQLPGNQGRDLKYDRSYGVVQENAIAYRGLGPLHLDQKPDNAYQKAEIIAGEVQGWQITYRDPPSRTIEGVATSPLFRFKDDFVIQVRPAPDGGSLVEMRSKSRDGKGDLGVNYHRIRSFFRMMGAMPRGVAQAQ
jgi:uncharacterized protein (DUF1499 family)